MTSRVQKGGTLFRPVVKSRNRTADRPSEPPRQPSLAVESTQNDSIITLPTSIHSQTLDTPRASSQATNFSNVDDASLPSSNVIHPLDFSSSVETPPIPVSSTITPDIENAPTVTIPPQTRGRPVPIIIGSRTLSGQSTQSSSVSWASATTESAGLPIPSPSSIAPSNSTSSIFSPSSVVVGSTRAQLNPPVIAASTLTQSTQPPESSDQVPGDSSRTTTKTKKANPRKRKASAEQETSGETDGDGTPEPSSSGKPRGRRKRKPSPLPYDPDADPGEDIDPTTTTMATLCEDTGQGRVSTKAAEILSNHVNWKARNRDKRTRMKAIMEAKKYGREIEDDESPDAPAEQSTSNAEGATPSSGAAVVDESGSGFDYSQDLATSRYNVQIRIGPNGETIIDEESLTVDRNEHDATENYTHIEESDHTKFVNSGTYGKRYRGSRWSAEETELFYDALAQYGENYELIAYVLPGRDRKACKNKFKAEDKKNPARINHCLNNSVPVDMKTLSRMTGKDFSGPVPEIRVPNPPPQIQAPEPPPEPTTEPGKSSKKKRSRSRVHNDDAVVVGSTENFDS